MVLFCLLQICEWHHSTTSMKRERSSKNGGICHWCHIVSDCVWHSSDGFLYGSWLVWFLACVWLWMKWTRVLSSCHIVFVVRSDHFHRKSQTQASSTSDIFIKLLIVQWICIWYTKNLLSKLLELIVKNTKNLCKRLIPSTFLMYRTVINQHTHVWTYSWIFCIIWQPQNSGCHYLLTSHLMANYWQRLEWYTQ